MWLLAFLRHRFDQLSKAKTGKGSRMPSPSTVGDLPPPFAKPKKKRPCSNLSDNSNHSRASSGDSRNQSPERGFFGERGESKESSVESGPSGAREPVRPADLDRSLARPTSSPAGPVGADVQFNIARARQPKRKAKNERTKGGTFQGGGKGAEATDKDGEENVPPPHNGEYTSSVCRLVDGIPDLFDRYDDAEEGTRTDAFVGGLVGVGGQVSSNVTARNGRATCGFCGLRRNNRGVGVVFCHVCSGVDDRPLSDSMLYAVFERKGLEWRKALLANAGSDSEEPKKDDEENASGSGSACAQKA